MGKTAQSMQGHFVKAEPDFGLVSVRGQLLLHVPKMFQAALPESYQFQRRFVYAITNDITLNYYDTTHRRSSADNAGRSDSASCASPSGSRCDVLRHRYSRLRPFGPQRFGKSEIAHSLTLFFIPSETAPTSTIPTKAGASRPWPRCLMRHRPHRRVQKHETRHRETGIPEGLYCRTVAAPALTWTTDKKRETTAVNCGVIRAGKRMPYSTHCLFFPDWYFLPSPRPPFPDDEKSEQQQTKADRKARPHLEVHCKAYITASRLGNLKMENLDCGGTPQSFPEDS